MHGFSRQNGFFGLSGLGPGATSSGSTPAEQIAALIAELQTGLSGSAKSGIWIPDDLSTLYSDSGRTTPATDTGPVGSVSDLSGNDNHWLQATAGNRPLASDGVTFDADNDSMGFAFAGGAGSSSMDVVVGFRTLEPQGILFRDASDRYFGFWRANASTSLSTGGDVYLNDVAFVNGVNTQAEFRTSFITGEWNRVEARGVDLSTWTTLAFAASSFGTIFVGGSCSAMVVIDRGDFTEGEADALRALAQELIDLVNDSLALFEATWTWFNDPRVLTLGEDHYVLGGVASDGSIVVAEERDGAFVSQTNLSPQLEVDDHNNPGFIKRASDDRLLAFFCTHGTTDEIFVSVSTSPNDPSAWAAPVDIGPQINSTPQTVGFTYANVVQLDSGRIYLFGRSQESIGGYRAWFYSYTDDPSGLTGWQPRIHLAPEGNSDRAYYKIRKNGPNRIDLFTEDGNPGDIAPTPNSLYHHYLLDTAGTITFHQTDGTLIADPTVRANLTKVYDANGTTRPTARVQDMVIIEGVPVLAFDTFDDLVTDHRYHQARYSGGAWTTEEVCAAGGELYSGQNYYSGCVITDPEDADVMYASRQVDTNGDASASGRFRMYRLDRVGAGNWSETFVYMDGTTAINKVIRPYIPEGGRRLFGLVGRYNSFSGNGTPSGNNFDTYVRSVDLTP